MKQGETMIYTVSYTVRENGLEHEYCTGAATWEEAKLLVDYLHANGAWGIEVGQQVGEVSDCIAWGKPQ